MSILSHFRAPLILCLAIVLAVLAFAPKANATELPYTVDATGITLTVGAFPDNGHVNIDSLQSHADLHFESKCITRTDAECAGARHDAAQYIGQAFIPWSAFGLTGCFTVSWVQVAGENYHWGAQGETPLEVGCTVIVPPTNPPVEECPPGYTRNDAGDCIQPPLVCPEGYVENNGGCTSIVIEECSNPKTWTPECEPTPAPCVEGHTGCLTPEEPTTLAETGGNPGPGILLAASAIAAAYLIIPKRRRPVIPTPRHFRP